MRQFIEYKKFEGNFADWVEMNGLAYKKVKSLINLGARIINENEVDALFKDGRNISKAERVSTRNFNNVDCINNAI